MLLFQRLNEISGIVKSFIDPTNVLTLYEHFAQLCLGGRWCNFDTIPPQSALVFHYKSQEFNNDTIAEKTIFKFKDQLERTVKKTLEEIKLTP